MAIASKILTLLVATLLVGCSMMSMSEVAKVDKDSYVVSASAKGRFIDNQELFVASSRKAADFCAEQGLDMVRDDSLLSHKGINNREFMFNFRCVNK